MTKCEIDKCMEFVVKNPTVLHNAMAGVRALERSYIFIPKKLSKLDKLLRLMKEIEKK